MQKKAQFNTTLSIITFGASWSQTQRPQGARLDYGEISRSLGPACALHADRLYARFDWIVGSKLAPLVNNHHLTEMCVLATKMEDN